jgi:hypothetical protein
MRTRGHCGLSLHPPSCYWLAAGVSEVSRFSCMKLPGVSGVFDYAGPTRDSRYRPRRVAFHQVKSVGVLIASFRSSIPSPPVPLFTLRRTPRGAQRKTRGRAVRYSFLVGLFHSLLHAGLSRRTDSAITQQMRFPTSPDGTRYQMEIVICRDSAEVFNLLLSYVGFSLTGSGVVHANLLFSMSCFPFFAH